MPVLICREGPKCGIVAGYEGWLGNQPELGSNPKFPVTCPWTSHLTSLSFKFLIYTMRTIFQIPAREYEVVRRKKWQIKQGVSKLHPMSQNQHTVYFCKSNCIGIQPHPLMIVCNCFYNAKAQFSSCGRELYCQQSQKYLLSGSLQRRSANLWTRPFRILIYKANLTSTVSEVIVCIRGFKHNVTVH